MPNVPGYRLRERQLRRMALLYRFIPAGWNDTGGTIRSRPRPACHLQIGRNRGKGLLGRIPEGLSEWKQLFHAAGATTIPVVAPKISYTFTIPPGRTISAWCITMPSYCRIRAIPLSSNPAYAVEVMNLTDNKIDPARLLISWSMVPLQASRYRPSNRIVRSFAIKNGPLPLSTFPGNAGKTFSISFLTTDCSLGAHFGYAYIDINSICSNTVPGSVYCPDDKFLELTAPRVSELQMVQQLHQTVLGSGATRLEPPRFTRDTIYVAFDPFSGYGCRIHSSPTWQIPPAVNRKCGGDNNSA